MAEISAVVTCIGTLDEEKLLAMSSGDIIGYAERLGYNFNRADAIRFMLSQWKQHPVSCSLKEWALTSNILGSEHTNESIRGDNIAAVVDIVCNGFDAIIPAIDGGDIAHFIETANVNQFITLGTRNFKCSDGEYRDVYVQLSSVANEGFFWILRRVK